MPAPRYEIWFDIKDPNLRTFIGNAYDRVNNLALQIEREGERPELLNQYTQAVQAFKGALASMPASERQGLQLIEKTIKPGATQFFGRNYVTPTSAQQGRDIYVDEFIKGVTPTNLPPGRIEAAPQGNTAPITYQDTATTAPVPPPTPASAPYLFNKQLDYGTRDPAVRELQKSLNALGFTVAKSGAGSPGQETDYFGPATQAALRRFQTTYGIVSSGDPKTTGFGRLGPKTLAKLNQVVGDSYQKFSAPPTPPDGTSPTPPPAGEGTSSTPTPPSTLASEQSQDPKLKPLIDNLPPELQSLYNQLSNYLESNIESGQTVNPDIEISPELISQFTTQAEAEFDPYYKEQLGLMRGDLERGLRELTDSYRLALSRGEKPFQQQLASQAQAEAEAGTAFSSGRAEREAGLVTGRNQALEDAFRQTQEQGQELVRKYERELGSENLNNVAFPTASESTANLAGQFTPTSRQLTFTPEGAITGTVPRERKLAVSGRTEELKRAELARRFANL